MKRGAIAVFLTLAACAPLWELSAQQRPTPTLQLKAGGDRYLLNDWVQAFVDRTGRLTIEEISSVEFNGRFASPGAGSKVDLRSSTAGTALWLRLRINASLRQQDRWVIEVPGVHWKSVQLHGLTGKGNWHTVSSGRTLPMDPTIVSATRLALPLPVPLLTEQLLYVRLASDEVTPLRPTLWTAQRYQQQISREQYLMGMYQGILIIMVISNLFLFFSVRDKSYLFYTIYVSALVMFFMLDDGVGLSYFWLKPDLWMYRLSATLFTVFQVFFVLFVRSFLQTKQNTPLVDKTLTACIPVSIASVLVFVTVPESSASLGPSLAGAAMVTSILLMIVSVMTAGILTLRQGFTPARYFLIASSLFLGAMMVSAFQALELLPGFEIGQLSMRLGALTEAVLYSFALADRFKFERQLKEESQRQAIDEQTRMTATFEKFVPKQFLERVAKEGIQSIRLGTVESDYITVLFSDIRAFTTFSEAQKAEEVFEFLNAYLSEMEPPIVKHGGFVDKFIGDAIMALFDSRQLQHQSDGALRAALGMQKTLRQYNAANAGRPHHPIATGIGIHSGNVMIGTVGSSTRMDSTAIGDTVNIASRIEGMTKSYGAGILISETTFANLSAPSDFCIRMVDRVVAKGKSTPITIYEVFDEDPEPIKAGKLQTRPQFEQAVLSLANGDRKQALDLFKECRSLFTGDPAVQFYLERNGADSVQRLPTQRGPATHL